MTNQKKFSKNKKNNRNKKEKMINLSIGILCTVIVVGCLSLVFYFGSLSYDSGEFSRLIEMAEDRGGDIIEDPSSDSIGMEKGRVINIARLQEENGDIAGWVMIPDTKIDYPVMYTPKDAEYYLHRNFAQKYSMSGVPFIDAECSLSPQSDNIIVHGHNMKNGSMFSDIISYQEENFWKEHGTILLYTLDEVQEYEVIAAFPINAEDTYDVGNYFPINFGDENQFNSFIKEIRRKSFNKTETQVKYGEQLLTLSTCSYHTTDGRYLVISKRVK